MSSTYIDSISGEVGFSIDFSSGRVLLPAEASMSDLMALVFGFVRCRSCAKWSGDRDEQTEQHECSCPRLDDCEDPMGAHHGEAHDVSYFETGPDFGCLHWRKR